METTVTEIAPSVYRLSTFVDDANFMFNQFLIDADDYGGDAVRTAAAVPGVTALSPNYGFPQNGKVGDPSFRFYSDAAMVSQAHALGLKVIPWTCDDPATVEALMDMGADGVITNYPNRVREIMAERGMRLPKAYQPR